MTNKIKIFRVLCASFIFSIVSSAVYARSELDLNLVKLDPNAANGRCLPNLAGDPNNILRQSGITVTKEGSDSQITNPNDDRLRALARVVKSIRALGSEEINQSLEGPIVLGGGNRNRGVSTNRGELITLSGGPQNNQNMRPPTSNGGVENSALISHMLAYRIGNTNGFYDRYRAAVSGRCLISRHARSNPRAEFAEVMTAYLTNPELLSNKNSTACNQAYAFMRSIFTNDEDSDSGYLTCEERRSAITNALQASNDRVTDANSSPTRAREQPVTPQNAVETESSGSVQ